MAQSKVDKEAVRAWVNSGEPRMQTIVRASDQWGLSHAKASRLVHQAVNEAADTLGCIERREFLAQQMTRLEALTVRAQEEGNLAVALGCIKELNALAKLHGS